MSENLGSSDRKRIYLDNNATTRPLGEVVEVMSREFREGFANPGSRHAEGRKARKALEEAREQMAQILGADPQEVIFTSGGTEATNLAIFGFTGVHPGKGRRERSAGPGGDAPGTIVLTAGEHPATMESCRFLEREGWRLRLLEVDGDGVLLPEQFDSLPWEEIRLVTVILAHNETGVIQDVRPLAAKCREHGVPFHVDGVQGVGKIPVKFHELGVSSLALGAHKFHGPRGIGALLLRRDAQLSPFEFGGHQEAGRRPGTELVALAAGMAKALELWDAQHQQRGELLAALHDRLQTGLEEQCRPVVVNGKGAARLPNTLNIAFPGVDGEALLVALDLEGIACSLGSTCASGSAEPAPALVAMGCPPEVYRSSVRFSVGMDNTPAEIDEGVRRIAAVVGRLRSGCG